MSTFGSAKSFGSDVIQLAVEEDGTITITTDQVSPQNHKSADDFVAEVGRLAGGEATKTKRREKHSHGHHQHHLHHKA